VVAVSIHLKGSSEPQTVGATILHPCGPMSPEAATKSYLPLYGFESAQCSDGTTFSIETERGSPQ